LVGVPVELDRMEEAQVSQARRLIEEMDEVLRLLAAMAEMHKGNPGLSASIRERMDSTLDERLRLMEMARGGERWAENGGRWAVGGGRTTADCQLPTANCQPPTAHEPGRPRG
jgi:hypothetical protein